MSTPKAITQYWKKPVKFGATGYLPVDVIEIEEGFNPRRFDTPDMRERLDHLKKSIRLRGVEKELLVRQDQGKVFLVGGETRLLACRELIAEGANIQGVPVKFIKAMDVVSRLLMAVTDNTGRQLTQLESGSAYARLQAYGMTVDQIADEVGVPKRYVTESIALTDVPHEVKKLVAAKLVTASRALAEVREHGSASVVVLAQKVREAQACGERRVLRREKRDAPTVGRLKHAVKLLVRSAGEFAKYDLNADLLGEIEIFVGEVGLEG